MNNIALQQLSAMIAGVPGVRLASNSETFSIIEITNAFADCAIALHGAHVIRFQPRGSAPILWVSQKSKYQAGTAIRGGIPICWPWFGKDPENPRKPSHGFARILFWRLQEIRTPGDGSTEAILVLDDRGYPPEFWPHQFRLTFSVVVAASLSLRLTMTNTGDTPFHCTSALHSYFHISDVGNVTIHGLDGCRYIDTVNNAMAEKTQEGPVVIDAEVDRIYMNTQSPCTIRDSGLHRTIRVVPEGSRSTVVWNPWSDKARSMADFGDDEYRQMVCVETANAGPDMIILPPGAQHILGTEIQAQND